MSDLHVVSASSRRDSPGLADTGGQDARTSAPLKASKQKGASPFMGLIWTH
jgi:hypothetical protein